MSILIRGMEMPAQTESTIQVYDAYLRISPSGEHALVVDDPDCELSGVYDLIPVPPHGRLIDADALKENWCVTELGNKVVEVVEIDGAPTIIPAEPYNNLSKPCKAKEAE